MGWAARGQLEPGQAGEAWHSLSWKKHTLTNSRVMGHGAGSLLLNSPEAIKFFFYYTFNFSVCL